MSEFINLVRPRGEVPPGRCCESHPDWPTLTEHLIEGFPALALEEIVGAVAEAKTATDGMSLPGPEALVTGETLARQHLQERAAALGAKPLTAHRPRG